MPATRRLKLILTFGCYFSYFTYAFGFYIVAATLLDIMANVNSTFQEVSYGIVIRSSTYCFGALLSGWFYDRIDRRLGLVVSTIIMAFTCFLIPFIDKLRDFLVVLGVMGVASAGIEVAVNAWILQLWKEDCNIYMQGMHFAYAVGVAMAPAIASPFLSETTSLEVNSNSTFTNQTHHLHSHSYDSSEAVIEFKSPATFDDLSEGLFIPYLITAVVLLIAAVVQTTFYFVLPNGDPVRGSDKTLDDKRENRISTPISEDDQCKETSLLNGTGLSPKLTPHQPRSYRTVMIISGCALTCFYAGLEMNTFIFLPDFAVSALSITGPSAAAVSTYMSASYATFRFIAIFVASRVTTIKMLYIHVSLIGLSNFLILYSTSYAHSYVLLTISSIILGTGLSSVYPAIYSYLEEKITVTNSLCGLFMFTSSILTSINPILEGRYLKDYPSIFVTINLTGFVYVIMILIMLEVTYRKRN